MIPFASWFSKARMVILAISTVFAKGVASLEQSIDSKAKRWKIPEISSTVSLDPVSLITMFFDAPEKELIKRSGDMSRFCCFGLFVNPTTAWVEYGTLYPYEGVRYYNPKRSLTSTVEVAQVHNYVIRLANRRQNCGIIVQLSPRKSRTPPSLEWLVIRPLTLAVIIFIAAASADFKALGALAALIVGQAIVVIQTVKHGTPKVIDDHSTLEQNVFFLANNVTLLVQSDGSLFKETCSNLKYKKAEKPVTVEILSTLIFMTGILLMGTAGLNSKIVYLVGHAFQAVMLALYSRVVLDTRTVNHVTWEVKKHLTRRLERRRDAYVQSGLTVPYIPEPNRTVPSIFEPNRLPARNFRARAEPNRGPNARARQCTVRIIYEPNRIDCWNARFGTVRLGDVRLKSDVILCL